MSGSYARLDIDIQDESSLAFAADALHDAIFGRDDVLFDASAQTFRLILWREVPELVRRERVLVIMHRVLVPRVRSALEFVAVRQAIVERKDPSVSGGYCLENAVYDPARTSLRLQVMGPLEIELRVYRLQGSLRDTGEPTWDAPSIPTFGLGR